MWPNYSNPSRPATTALRRLRELSRKVCTRNTRTKCAARHTTKFFKRGRGPHCLFATNRFDLPREITPGSGTVCFRNDAAARGNAHEWRPATLHSHLAIEPNKKGKPGQIAHAVNAKIPAWAQPTLACARTEVSRTEQIGHGTENLCCLQSLDALACKVSNLWTTVGGRQTATLSPWRRPAHAAGVSNTFPAMPG